MECRLLSADDLAALLAGGWAVVGGPYDNPDDCAAQCVQSSSASSSSSSASEQSSSGSSGSESVELVSIVCCPHNLVPAILYATVAGSPCACVNGVWELHYSDDFPIYHGGVHVKGWVSDTFILTCDGQTEEVYAFINCRLAGDGTPLWNIGFSFWNGVEPNGTFTLSISDFTCSPLSFSGTCLTGIENQNTACNFINIPTTITE